MKKFLCILLALCMVISMAPAALAAGDVFTDVEAEDWYVTEVEWAYNKGLMNGTGDNAFSPEVATTRGMIVTVLWRMEDSPAAEGEQFDDVADDAYYADAIKWAAANKIVEGYGDGKFGPADPITREQLATILYRYAQYKNYDVSATNDLGAYTDAADVNAWAKDAMQWAVGAGLIGGMTDDTLVPQGPATRAQVAVILYRFDGSMEPVTPDVPDEPEEPEKPVTPSIPVHFHRWTAGTPVPPTCTTEGYTPYTCDCGASKNDDTVPAVSHVAGEKCTHCGVIEVATAEQLAAALKAGDENIHVVLMSDIDLPITSLGSQTSGSGEYKLGGENTKNITIDLNNKRLNITTTYWSAIGAKNNDATITIKNGTMTSTGNSAQTWNAYDVRFSNCNYVIENVTFEKSVALDNAGKTTVMNKVTINDTCNSDVYGLWITAEGQTVTLNNCTIDTTGATDGRGIKIDEQYVDAPAKVTLNVSDTTFKTEEKSAILVKSKAGADITLSNVDISDVVADNVIEVWIDEDSADYYDLVTVTGGDKILEGTNLVAVKTADELVSAFANLKANDIIYIANDIDMSGKSITPVTGNVGFTMRGNGNTISNLTSTQSALFVDQSGSSSYTFDGVVLESCSVTSTDNYAALFVGDGDTSDAITITNCHVKNCSVVSVKYAAAFVGYTAGWNVQNDGPVYSDVTIAHCSVTGGSITGGGSVGAAIGHAGGNVDTTNTITGFTVSGLAINGEDTEHTGIVVGTANIGETIISDVTYTDVTGNYNTATKIYGRFVPNATGVLIIDGAHVVTSADALSDVISGATGEEVEVTLAAGEYKIPSSSTAASITITGTKDTVVDMSDGTYMDNGKIAFEGVTIKLGLNKVNGGKGSDYTALYSKDASFTKCTFEGGLRVGRDGAVFTDCTFNLGESDYVYNYGNNTTFINCTFNTAGKALISYSDGNGAVPTMTVTGCTFNATQSGYAYAITNQACAAIEIDNYGCGVDLTISDTKFVDTDFSGLWRIKSYAPNDGDNPITVNGVPYTGTALDGDAITVVNREVVK